MRHEALITKRVHLRMDEPLLLGEVTHTSYLHVFFDTAVIRVCSCGDGLNHQTSIVSLPLSCDRKKAHV